MNLGPAPENSAEDPTTTPQYKGNLARIVVGVLLGVFVLVGAIMWRRSAGAYDVDTSDAYAAKLLPGRPSTRGFIDMVGVVDLQDDRMALVERITAARQQQQERAVSTYMPPCSIISIWYQMHCSC